MRAGVYHHKHSLELIPRYHINCYVRACEISQAYLVIPMVWSLGTPNIMVENTLASLSNYTTIRAKT